MENWGLNKKKINNNSWCERPKDNKSFVENVKYYGRQNGFGILTDDYREIRLG